MFIAKVIGNVWATRKHAGLKNATLLLVKAVDPLDKNKLTGEVYAQPPAETASPSPAMKTMLEEQGVAIESLRPAVPVKRSVTPDYIVCLEDGQKFKSLKRHLRTQYNMTPEQYREKWGLGADYPMVAPNYAAARSQLAKQMGLGQQRRRRKERG